MPISSSARVDTVGQVAAVEAALEHEVLPAGGQVVGAAELADVADPLAHLLGLAWPRRSRPRSPCRRRSGSSVVSIRRRRRLAGAVGSEEAEDLAAGHVDAHPADRVDGAPCGSGTTSSGRVVVMMLSMVGSSSSVSSVIGRAGRSHGPSDGLSRVAGRAGGPRATSRCPRASPSSISAGEPADVVRAPRSRSAVRNSSSTQNSRGRPCCSASARSASDWHGLHLEAERPLVQQVDDVVGAAARAGTRARPRSW